MPRPPSLAKLTEKQRRFVDAYQGEAAGNATQAAKLAGYKGNDNTVSSIATENLQKPAIIQALAELRKSCPLIATREDRQRFWTNVMIGREADADMRDRLKAAELLGRSQADFINRVETSGPGGGPVQLQAVNTPDLSGLTTDELRAYRELQEKAAALIKKAR